MTLKHNGQQDKIFNRKNAIFYFYNYLMLSTPERFSFRFHLLLICGLFNDAASSYNLSIPFKLY